MRLVKHPILCNYYVTYRCNATCGFCDIWEKPSPYVTLAEAEKNFLSLKKLGVKVIDFTGGEPLLHREIDQLLTLAKKHGFITTLTTNCLLYPKWAKRLKGLVDMLHFSLDSHVKEDHDSWRGVACYDFVMESIALAVSLGERPDVLMTVFDHNLDQVELIRKNVTAPNDLVLILNPAFDYNDVESHSSNKSLHLKKLKTEGRKKGVYLNSAFVTLRQDGGNNIKKPVCKAGSTTLVITPENKLSVPCYHLGTKEFSINGDLYELYYSPEVQKIIKLEGRLPECEGCVINCYMQPSFAVNVNKYWFKALPSTLKYNKLKGTWKHLSLR